MKSFSTVLLILLLNLSSSYAVEGVAPSKSKNCATKDIQIEPAYDCGGFVGIGGPEDNDPLEPINRGVFWLNQGIDYLIIEPVAWAYKEIVPEYGRDRVSNILRNLNEPIVLANNLLQGKLEDARGTIWRFVINSTLGVGGIFDVSTDLGFPYKKEDLGLTFASWGIEPGPYLVLPILGPSSIRDGWGRLGDYAVDPINWAMFGLSSTSRSGIQILDAKADNIEIVNEIKNNAIDYYASIRSWYTERRAALMTAVEDRTALDTPRPTDDDDDDETDAIKAED